MHSCLMKHEVALTAIVNLLLWRKDIQSDVQMPALLLSLNLFIAKDLSKSVVKDNLNREPFHVT